MKALRSATSDDAKAEVSSATNKIALDGDGRRTVIAAGAREAEVEASKSAASLRRLIVNA